MIYLDYSATTPVRKEVLDIFNKVTIDYPGNANSLHKLGVDSKKIMDKSTQIVADIFNVKPSEVIFTSSASESNNFAIKSVATTFNNRGRHIITTKLEHSSILETVSYLEKNGYEIDYIDINSDGLINMDDLKSKIRKDTILVSIHHVNSEVGIRQDINNIGKIIKSINNRCLFHVDGTQAVGKIKVCLDNIDMYTFSAHKFYGLKGIGCLIKKNNINLDPLIHGGKSQSEFRSGTPAINLMASLSKALKLVNEDINKNYEYVLNLNKTLVNELEKLDGVVINSGDTSIPHILNISVLGIKPEVMLHALENEDIYISTKTACSKDNSDSLSLTTMNKDKSITSSSIRISLSYLTTMKEINIFVDKLKKCINDLRF